MPFPSSCTQPSNDRRADPLQRKDELEYWLTEHLRLNGLYWGLTALHLLGQPDALPRNEILDFVCSCLHENGGFGAAPGHDAHMLYTVSAVQILATLNAFEEFDERIKGGRQKVGKCASALKPLYVVNAHAFQSLQIFKTLTQVPSRGTSGESETRASCMAH